MEPSEDDDELPAVAQRRFETELEFVQALANPEYLHFLAQNLYFDDPAFRDYLVYLQYWREPRYCKFGPYQVSHLGNQVDSRLIHLSMHTNCVYFELV